MDTTVIAARDLLHAVTHDQVDVVRTLLCHATVPDLYTAIVDPQRGYTLLATAAARGSRGMIDALLVSKRSANETFEVHARAVAANNCVALVAAAKHDQWKAFLWLSHCCHYFIASIQRPSLALYQGIVKRIVQDMEQCGKRVPPAVKTPDKVARYVFADVVLSTKQQSLQPFLLLTLECMAWDTEEQLSCRKLLRPQLDGSPTYHWPLTFVVLFFLTDVRLTHARYPKRTLADVLRIMQPAYTKMWFNPTIMDAQVERIQHFVWCIAEFCMNLIASRESIQEQTVGLLNIAYLDTLSNDAQVANEVLHFLVDIAQSSSIYTNVLLKACGVASALSPADSRWRVRASDAVRRGLTTTDAIAKALFDAKVISRSCAIMWWKWEFDVFNVSTWPVAQLSALHHKILRHITLQALAHDERIPPASLQMYRRIHRNNAIPRHLPCTLQEADGAALFGTIQALCGVVVAPPQPLRSAKTQFLIDWCGKRPNDSANDATPCKRPRLV